MMTSSFDEGSASDGRGKKRELSEVGYLWGPSHGSSAAGRRRNGDTNDAVLPVLGGGGLGKERE